MNIAFLFLSFVCLHTALWSKVIIVVMRSLTANRTGNAQIASFTSNRRAQEFASQLESATGKDFWVKKQD